MHILDRRQVIRVLGRVMVDITKTGMLVQKLKMGIIRAIKIIHVIVVPPKAVNMINRTVHVLRQPIATNYARVSAPVVNVRQIQRATWIQVTMNMADNIGVRDMKTVPPRNPVVILLTCRVMPTFTELT